MLLIPVVLFGRSHCSVLHPSRLSKSVLASGILVDKDAVLGTQVCLEFFVVGVAAL